MHRTHASGLARRRRRWTTWSRGPRGRTPTSSASRREPRDGRRPPPARGAAPLVKFLAYGWSSRRSRPRSTTRSSRRSPRRDLDRLGRSVDEQRARLDEFWAGADVELDGDPEVQQAVRFALFSVFQASARAERRPIPAKGLTGPGYDGHTFWDTETFVLPVLTYTEPGVGRRRAPLAPAVDPAGHGARPFAGPARRGVPLADDSGRGVLWLLAGQHRGVPHQRRHQRRRSCATWMPRMTSSSTGGRRCRSWSRPPGSGADSVTTMRRGVPDRRRDRSRRVRRARRQQRVHEPHGRAEPARRGRRGRTTPRPSPKSSASRRGGGASWRDAAMSDDASRSTTAPGRPPAERGVHASTRAGTSPPRNRIGIPVPALPVLRPLPQAGGEAGRPRARDALPRRRVHRRAEGAETSPTTSSSPSGTPRCRRARRRSSPPRSAISSSRTTTSARPR